MRSATAEQTVPLRGDAAISGRVVDSTYDPPRVIPGATVRLDDSPIVKQSDEQGQFVVDGIPSGAVRLVVSAPGYSDCKPMQRLRPVSGNAPNHPLGDVALAGNSEVQGTVVSEGSGEPVAQAEVRIPGTTVAAITDADGHYCLSGLPPGQFDLAVAAAGYEPLELKDHKVVESDKNPLKLAMKKDAVVRTDDRAPVPEVVKNENDAGEVGSAPLDPRHFLRTLVPPRNRLGLPATDRDPRAQRSRMAAKVAKAKVAKARVAKAAKMKMASRPGARG